MAGQEVLHRQLDGGEGVLDFVRDLPRHLAPRRGLFDAHAQLLRLADLACHAVERADQVAELVRAILLQGGAEIAGGDALRRFAQLAHRAGQRARQIQCHEHGQERRREIDRQQERVALGGAPLQGAAVIEGRRHQDQVAPRQAAHPAVGGAQPGVAREVLASGDVGRVLDLQRKVGARSEAPRQQPGVPHARPARRDQVLTPVHVDVHAVVRRERRAPIVRDLALHLLQEGLGQIEAPLESLRHFRLVALPGHVLVVCREQRDRRDRDQRQEHGDAVAEEEDDGPAVEDQKEHTVDEAERGVDEQHLGEREAALLQQAVRKHERAEAVARACEDQQRVVPAVARGAVRVLVVQRAGNQLVRRPFEVGGRAVARALDLAVEGELREQQRLGPPTAQLVQRLGKHRRPHVGQQDVPGVGQQEARDRNGALVDQRLEQEVVRVEMNALADATTGQERRADSLPVRRARQEPRGRAVEVEGGEQAPLHVPDLDRAGLAGVPFRRRPEREREVLGVAAARDVLRDADPDTGVGRGCGAYGALNRPRRGGRVPPYKCLHAPCDKLHEGVAVDLVQDREGAERREKDERRGALEPAHVAAQAQSREQTAAGEHQALPWQQAQGEGQKRKPHQVAVYRLAPAPRGVAEQERRQGEETDARQQHRCLPARHDVEGIEEHHAVGAAHEQA